MPLAPKTKGKIKALMHRVFEKAMFWELIPVGRNPMSLVEMNVYGNSMMESKREANSKVVQMALRSPLSGKMKGRRSSRDCPFLPLRQKVELLVTYWRSWLRGVDLKPRLVLIIRNLLIVQ